MGIYDTYGVNYGATQLEFWQDVPYKKDPVYKLEIFADNAKQIVRSVKE